MEYQKEIRRAISARGDGNEGMARVCARRAAGLIIGEYLVRKGYTNLTRSIYDLISVYNSLPEKNANCTEILNHVVMKVNSDHGLPVEADLIDEVQWLAKTLLLEKNE